MCTYIIYKSSKLSLSLPISKPFPMLPRTPHRLSLRDLQIEDQGVSRARVGRHASVATTRALSNLPLEPTDELSSRMIETFRKPMERLDYLNSQVGASSSSIKGLYERYRGNLCTQCPNHSIPASWFTLFPVSVSIDLASPGFCVFFCPHSASRRTSCRCARASSRSWRTRRAASSSSRRATCWATSTAIWRTSTSLPTTSGRLGSTSRPGASSSSVRGLRGGGI